MNITYKMIFQEVTELNQLLLQIFNERVAQELQGILFNILNRFNAQYWPH